MVDLIFITKWKGKKYENNNVYQVRIDELKEKDLGIVGVCIILFRMKGVGCELV